MKLILEDKKQDIDLNNPLEEINKIASRLPLFVLKDIDKRITDWLATGGKEDDPYIEQQLRFAKRFVKGDPHE